MHIDAMAPLIICIDAGCTRLPAGRRWLRHFGPIGRLAEKLVLARYVQTLIETRN